MEFINAYVPVEPVIDEVYHSDSYNKIVVFSQVYQQSDWFSCKWAITPKENRTDVKRKGDFHWDSFRLVNLIDKFEFTVCRDYDAGSPYGTITPLTVVSDTSEQQCYFSIVAPPEKEVQISCSSIYIDTDSSLFYVSLFSLLFFLILYCYNGYVFW